MVAGVLLLLFAASVVSIANAGLGAGYVAAAQRQSRYQLQVANARGMIYDYNLTPLLGEKRQLVAAVSPTPEAIGALETATGGTMRDRLKSALEDGKPFLLSLQEPLTAEGIDVFSVPQRYSDDQLAPHVIGYTDSLGAGVSGVELAMNDVLQSYGGEITVAYQVDALGHVLPGGDHEVTDTLTGLQGGVMLTLEQNLQQAVETAAARLNKGAVVVTEAPNCEVRAMASVPTFSQQNLAEAAEADNGALVNRALCAYAPGSVFKLVDAACALENGLGQMLTHCGGAVTVDGLDFHCIDSTAHGTMNLRGALMNSCNCYFINCARSLGGQTLLGMAYNLGLGAGQEFGRGMFAESGLLPDATALENARALANFSFGQGDTTVTPLQLCGMMNTIVSDGVYHSPRLIAGVVSHDKTVTEHHAVTEKTEQVLQPQTAKTLQSFLENTVTDGTAARGKPQYATAGAKTGTAQTGVYKDGEELLHFWYCGYVKPADGSCYCITVLAESATEDPGTAAVFAEIADYLAAAAEQP